jgi:signal-transduction protein with cAMP-binding, CBS, and nucleotidyltransferase domain
MECLIAVIIALKNSVYLPDDWIVKKGEVGRHLFIIRVGIVAVMEEDGSVITNLYEGSFFG